MPIANIIDERKHSFRWRRVNAIVEATWHDNCVANSDRVDAAAGGDDGPMYEEREHISVQEAIMWANTFNAWVTLYIYNEDGGIYPVEEAATGHHGFWPPQQD